MGEHPYQKTRDMPPLGELAKRLESPNDGAASKGKGKESREQGEIRKPVGIEAGVKFETPKERIRHSERVEAELKHFFATMTMQEEENEEEENKEKENKKAEPPMPTRKSERVKRKRISEDREPAQADDSPSGPSRATESRSNKPYTGGQPTSIDLTGESDKRPEQESDSRVDRAKETPETQSDSRVDRGQVGAVDPSIALPATEVIAADTTRGVGQ